MESTETRPSSEVQKAIAIQVLGVYAHSRQIYGHDAGLHLRQKSVLYSDPEIYETSSTTFTHTSSICDVSCVETYRG